MSKKEFIKEKITGRNNRRQQILRYVRVIISAVLFGAVSAFTFAAVLPAAKQVYRQYLPQQKEKESAEEPPEETIENLKESEESEPIADVVQSEIEKYDYSIEDFMNIYKNLMAVTDAVSKSIVEIHSIVNRTDMFNNPMENTNRYAGIIYKKTETEAVILTTIDAVSGVDEIQVGFKDKTSVKGSVKAVDNLDRIAAVSVLMSDIQEQTRKEIEAVSVAPAGSIHTGDILLAAGAPAGVVYSVAYDAAAAVLPGISGVDMENTLILTDMQANVKMGTFLLNAKGQLIGWLTTRFDDKQDITYAKAVCASDYKRILSGITDGIPAPYLGVICREIGTEEQKTLPEGIYVESCENESPAYLQGIQPGDIIVRVGGVEVKGLSDFENAISELVAGQSVTINVKRQVATGYKDMEFQIMTAAR